MLSIFISSAVMLANVSHAAPLNDLALTEKNLAPIFAKQAGVKITTKQGKEKEWRYPYLIGNTSSSLTQFNSWVRERSLRGLFPEDDAVAEKALKSKDSQVIAMLKADTAVQDAAAEASTISLDKRFGSLFFLTTQSVYGGDRYHIDVDSAIYDYEEDKEVNIASLFVEEAEQKLSDLLAGSIRKKLEKSKQESSACLMRKGVNPDYRCLELSIDTQQCINSVSFHWNWLEIKDSRHLRYHVPYQAHVAADCGYEDIFEINGANVEALFLEKARLKKAVRFKILRNFEFQSKE